MNQNQDSNKILYKWTKDQDEMIKNTQGSGANQLLGEMWNLDPEIIRRRRNWIQNQKPAHEKEKPKTTTYSVRPIINRPSWFEEDLENLIRKGK